MCQALREFMKEEIEDEVQKGRIQEKIATLAASVRKTKKMFGLDDETAMEAADVPSELREAVLAALG